MKKYLVRNRGRIKFILTIVFLILLEWIFFRPSLRFIWSNVEKQVEQNELLNKYSENKNELDSFVIRNEIYWKQVKELKNTIQTDLTSSSILENVLNSVKVDKFEIKELNADIQKSSEKFIEFPIELKAVGSFYGIQNYLSELETMQLIVQVSQLKILKVVNSTELKFYLHFSVFVPFEGD